MFLSYENKSGHNVRLKCIHFFSSYETENVQDKSVRNLKERERLGILRLTIVLLFFLSILVVLLIEASKCGLTDTLFSFQM